MKQILLPTDFSENSIKAIHYALLVFKDLKCTFYLLHAFTPPVYQTEYLLGNPGQIGLGDMLRESSEMQMKELQTQLKDQFNNPNHIFIPRIAFNILTDEISQTVVAENIDLIVMGTQGATNAAEILIGTQTVHVIKRAKCPVLAIPQKFKNATPKKILFPTDYEIHYEKEKLEQLLQIADLHGSSINVMHVWAGYELTEDQEKNKGQLKGLLGNLCLFHEVHDNGIIPAINEFLGKEKVDLLVMVRNKHTFLERLFIEPVIKKIGLHVTVPFMVLPYYN
ncbi:universal stress protein [Flavobacteriaceae bacterium F89]|uniref:Universal stress protein n=1 Tax=Cerina litoralis TaxID=2874477 RepID=A0AAE3JMN0_9FLAO|nr:universal stress protein [Cerina litoralis]MCG2460050.1 universal stress protein [Cerina litoralis]